MEHAGELSGFAGTPDEILSAIAFDPTEGHWDASLEMRIYTPGMELDLQERHSGLPIPIFVSLRRMQGQRIPCIKVPNKYGEVDIVEGEFAQSTICQPVQADMAVIPAPYLPGRCFASIMLVILE